MNRLRVVVAGAGAVGSVLALKLAQHGARVLLADGDALGNNASGVAAGMLAPVFESVVEAGKYPLLLEARDLWPALMHSLPGAPRLDFSGAMLRLLTLEVAERLADLTAGMGAEAQVLSNGRLRELAPLLSQSGFFLFAPGDWRLNPRAVLNGLHDAFAGLGGESKTASVTGFESGRVCFDRGEPWAADALILATGHKTEAWPEAAGEGHLTPIKGHILRFPGAGPNQGPVVRGDGGYIVPDPGGVIVGATMEVGRSDLDIDPEAVDRLRAFSSGLLPHLAEAPCTPFVGVRAATTDGLPLVGQGDRPGVYIARGARRNGWLLAPLMAQVMVDRLLERPPLARKRPV